MSVDWYGHLQVLHRATGNVRFHFTHGIHVYVKWRSTCWWSYAYLDGCYQHGGENHGPTLNEYLGRFVGLELVSMAADA